MAYVFLGRSTKERVRRVEKTYHRKSLRIYIIGSLVLCDLNNRANKKLRNMDRLTASSEQHAFTPDHRRGTGLITVVSVGVCS